MKPRLLLATLLIGAPAYGADCGAHLPELARQTIQGVSHTVAYAPSPWPIAAGKHFALDFEVCVRSGSSLPLVIQVDADMPMHKHGMNYRATVVALGSGRYRAEGLMFHMPGAWRVIFDLGGGSAAMRLSNEINVQ